MKAGLKIATAALTLTLFSSSAQATTMIPFHHDGFLLRLSTGLGHADSEIDDPVGNGETQLDGTAWDWNVAIGGVVAENLAIHGTFFGWWVDDPDLKITGDGLSSAGEFQGHLTMSAIGGGITYWLMPVNIYFSGSFAAAKLYLDDAYSPYDSDSDTGIAGDFTVGKEWWVGPTWGIGFAGGMSWHSIPDGGISEDWTGQSFVMRFSSTFN